MLHTLLHTPMQLLLNAVGSRESDSTVEVTGLGSIVDINSRDTSNFVAESVVIDGATRVDNIGNGNALGASLTSSSYANQSNGTTASVSSRSREDNKEDLIENRR